MSWKDIKLPNGSKLFRVYNFTFMHKGKTYMLEVDEFSDGSYSGHGEHSTDKNFVIESVSAGSRKACLEALIDKIQSRS